MKNVILFVTHKRRQCGVYEYGLNVFNAISKSTIFQFIKVECESLAELHAAISKHNPEVIIYNYHPSVLPWLSTKISKGVYRNNIVGIDKLQIGIIHEVTQKLADDATSYQNKYILGPSQKRLNSLFDYYIAPDPTLFLKNKYVFKTGRLVPQFSGMSESPALPTIGSFGFGTPNKGFDKLVSKVQEEFDEAVIRLNIPSADFGDSTGSQAKAIADICKKIVTKPGIQLIVTHDFLVNDQLLTFLSNNSINVFMYEDKHGRGISSAIDSALAVQRPIAVSDCPMFRHILDARPSVCLEVNSLKEILANGFLPLEKISKNWDEENFIWEYERILKRAITESKSKNDQPFGITRWLKTRIRKSFSLPEANFTWLRDTDAAKEEDDFTGNEDMYMPVILPEKNSLNCILDDKARELYQPALKMLFELVPTTMTKKIPRANIQQSFVFDTVFRFLQNYSSPKLLCVGSYEDTASMALRKMGFDVEDIDPMENYFLQEYFTKPSTKKNYYDIIFSTSVIEHDPDDKSFIECIEGLLSKNGIAVITCDYKDGWKKGDPKPPEDARFYTKNDLEKRLPSYLKESKLIDEGRWDCPNPDFTYLDKYVYTFATFVFKKSAQ